MSNPRTTTKPTSGCVSLAYDDLVALDIDALEVGGGAIGLLGPNGAGKSTLTGALATELSNRDGSAWKAVYEPVGFENQVYVICKSLDENSSDIRLDAVPIVGAVRDVLAR